MTKKMEITNENRFKCFWLCVTLLVVLLISNLSRDITRPFYGLHSWAQASGTWAARTHARYGLGYTKGVSTWAVGQPPTENPNRYWDHPQLNVLMTSVYMRIFGINEWASRVAGVTIASITLLIFLVLLRNLTDDITALLAGLFYVLFPITGYFGTGGWPVLLGFSAIWLYLRRIKIIKPETPCKRFHILGLGACIFFALQFGWVGFFFAMSIGIHYVGLCAVKRKWPAWPLLTVLVIAPALSLMVNFTVMAAGYGWDVNKIQELFKWRAAKGEMQQMQGFDWSLWFAKMWEFANTNFTLPVLIIAIAYLTIGQLYVFTAPRNPNDVQIKRRFPQFWLFFMIPFSQLFILRGALWKHQTWERPLVPFIAIAVALGLLVVFDVIKKINKKAALGICLVIFSICFVACIIGTNYYYNIRWQSPAKIKMFKMLNNKIPADKSLLSFEDFIVNQHKSKGGFYRPEIAWYLDREIVPAQSIEQISKYAATREFPCYLIPAIPQLAPLTNELRKKYKYEYIAGDGGEQKNGKFFRAGMYPYILFDLKSSK